MEYIKLNKSRHAVKHYDKKKIPTVDVKQMISTAVLAPSAHNMQPWLFAIVESDGKRAALTKEVNPSNVQQMQEAGAVVVLFSDTDLAARSQELASLGRTELSEELLEKLMRRYPEMYKNQDPQEKSDYLALNAGFVAMNFLYAVFDRGYVGNTLLGFARTSRVNEALGVDKRYRPELIFTIGASDEKGQPHIGLPQERFYKIV